MSIMNHTSKALLAIPIELLKLFIKGCGQGETVALSWSQKVNQPEKIISVIHTWM